MLLAEEVLLLATQLMHLLLVDLEFLLHLEELFVLVQHVGHHLSFLLPVLHQLDVLLLDLLLVALALQTQGFHQGVSTLRLFLHTLHLFLQSGHFLRLLARETAGVVLLGGLLTHVQVLDLFVQEVSELFLASLQRVPGVARLGLQVEIE